MDAASFVAESDAAPVDRTYMRVQHVGDPGTAELAREVGNAVAWNASGFTGVAASAEAQRGYLDAFGHSVFQLACGDAGFFINSSTFGHSAPLVGEGPSVSVARDFSSAIPVFRRHPSVVVEADVRIPSVQAAMPPIDEGTAQVSFFIYWRDVTSVTVVAQLVGLFDNRSGGTNGSGVEGLGDDGVNAFITSPLLAVDAAGRPVRFVQTLAGSATAQFVQPWVEPRHFAARITRDGFAQALLDLRASGLRISIDPADYVVQSFGLLGEIFPGTGHEHEVSLGASVSGLTLRGETR